MNDRVDRMKGIEGFHEGLIDLGYFETSKLTSYSQYIQQPAAANFNRNGYTFPMDAAIFWLQPMVMHFDISPLKDVSLDIFESIRLLHLTIVTLSTIPKIHNSIISIFLLGIANLRLQVTVVMYKYS